MTSQRLEDFDVTASASATPHYVFDSDGDEDDDDDNDDVLIAAVSHSATRADREQEKMREAMQAENEAQIQATLEDITRLKRELAYGGGSASTSVSSRALPQGMVAVLEPIPRKSEMALTTTMSASLPAHHSSVASLPSYHTSASRNTQIPEGKLPQANKTQNKKNKKLLWIVAVLAVVIVIVTVVVVVALVAKPSDTKAADTAAGAAGGVQSSMMPSSTPTPPPSIRPIFTIPTASIPSIMPEFQPSSAPSSNNHRKVLNTTNELREAVATYLSLDCQREPNAGLNESCKGISDWDVSQIQDFSGLFANQVSFVEDLSQWDVSNAIYMSSMFDNATSFNGDISSWNVSNVQDMTSMFAHATDFNGDISTWNVSNVQDTSYMFYGASSFNQDLSKWDVSNVQDMSYMFYGASSFNQDLSIWDVSNVQDMRSMFSYASSFNQDLCPWGEGVLQSDVIVIGMFFGTACENPKRPDLTTTPRGPFCNDCTDKDLGNPSVIINDSPYTASPEVSSKKPTWSPSEAQLSSSTNSGFPAPT